MNKMRGRLTAVDGNNACVNKRGYTKREADYMIGVLNKLLANYCVHFQKLRNFQWNVEGAEFFDLHQQFEQQSNFVRIAIDNIATRIRVFGYRPLCTLKDYLEEADVKETEQFLAATDMVKELLYDYGILLDSMLDVLNEAVVHFDSTTEDLVKELIQYTERNHWMMTAFTKNG